ncbi:MAG TPA: DUF4416 family protein [Candidatus Omnitrophota bacterium]|nr:DUF4416 family protein [Candidatus Omnitrophota bacterium]
MNGDLRNYLGVKVKLFTSVIYKDEDRFAAAETALRDLFGEKEDLEFFSAFDYTDYYYPELGRPLNRKVIVFKDLVSLEGSYKTKVETNELERKFSSCGRRTVNIDPGYLTEAKLALFTTKDYSHRIYSGEGIFAECTLFFRDGIFNVWPWTYPDYGSAEMREFFGKVRELYLADPGRKKFIRSLRSGSFGEES